MTKDGVIICCTVLGVIVLGALAIMAIIAALPVIIAFGFIGLIYWMLAKFFTGGFSPWRR